jgi:site-specific DNA-adenine methylase
MTTYQGGKKRIGKRIHDIIILLENDLSDENLNYFEPFVGMAGVLRHFGKDNNRFLHACDANEDLMLMWKALQKGWKPPLKCSKAKFERLRKSKKHSAERAFIGIVASYGGNFFCGYRLHLSNKRNYLREGYNGLMDIYPDIKKVNFLKALQYDEFDPENFLIYCDPPYKGNNLGPSSFKNFNSDAFWKKMRQWSKNNTVVISESSAPKDFRKLWSTQSFYNNQTTTKRYSDCLYIHVSLYNKLSPNIRKKIKNI